MYRIKKDLPNNKLCQGCDNLFYYNWYFCTNDKYNDKNGFLIENIEKCEDYKYRFSSAQQCKEKGLECCFWCNECENYERNL